jgi:class 3 adenylate cyclase
VVAAFDGGTITSDAGALLLGAADRVIGLVERFAGCFDDHRDPGRIEHSLPTLVGQRVFAWRWEEPLLGPAQPDPGKDLIDHEELRHDPALAAARCACALIEAAAALEPPWGLRAGLELGAVVAGIVGREPYQYDIWGDTVNVACRLCDYGEAGQLLVGPQAWLALRDSARGRALGTVELKGKGPVDVVEYTALI